MNNDTRHAPFVLRSLALATALTLGAFPAAAHDVYLRAAAFTKNVPDGSTGAEISMWGYAECDATFTTCGAITSPGPQIDVPAADSTLTIHLQNQLPTLDNVLTATSVLIPSLPKGLSPVKFTDGSFNGRVRSFDTETDVGAVVTYTWENVPAGTFMYQSGTHPQVQVQMGLYGAVVKNDRDATLALPARAYDPPTGSDVTYTHQSVLVYSEVDPSLHQAVADDVYGTAAGPTSTEGYHPRFFLINGEPFTAGEPLVIDAVAGQPLLLRLVNAGIENHAPQLLGGYFDVIAQDGRLAPTIRSQHTALLPAAKTLDVRFSPTAGNTTYSLLDRRLRLVNDTASAGGMLARIQTSAGNAPPVAIDDLFCIQTPVADETACTLQAGNVANGTLTTGGPGVLGNDSDPNGDPIRVTPGSVVVVSAPTGAFSVATGTGGGAGGLTFNPSDPDTTWLGVAELTYTVSENLPSPLTSNVATARVVRDMRVDSSIFRNDQGTTNDSWNLAGTLRTQPDGGVIYAQFVQNSANTNCTRVGLGLDGNSGAPTPPTAIPVNLDGTWSYTAARPDPAGCTRIRLEAQMPGGAVEAHATALETNLTRQDPTP